MKVGIVRLAHARDLPLPQYATAGSAGMDLSAAVDTDDTFSHTFAAPGEYPYICTIHPYMVGTIIVKPAGS